MSLFLLSVMSCLFWNSVLFASSENDSQVKQAKVKSNDFIKVLSLQDHRREQAMNFSLKAQQLGMFAEQSQLNEQQQEMYNMIVKKACSCESSEIEKQLYAGILGKLSLSVYKLACKKNLQPIANISSSKK